LGAPTDIPQAPVRALPSERYLNASMCSARNAASSPAPQSVLGFTVALSVDTRYPPPFVSTRRTGEKFARTTRPRLKLRDRWEYSVRGHLPVARTTALSTPD